jgi:hypothetical protein
MDDKTPDFHYFSDDDVRQILKVQGDIQTNIAVAANDVKWFIDTYKKQCVEIDGLKTEIKTLHAIIGSLKATMWKYIGIGIGIAIAVELLTLVLALVMNLRAAV